MPYVEAIWDLDDDENGNVQHIVRHNMTKDEVIHVLRHGQRRGQSRRSENQIVIGLTPSGRNIAVVYEVIDEFSVYPVTAYDV